MDEQSDVLWAGLREQSSSFFGLKPGESLLRLSVPDTALPLQLGATLVEWGGAQRWVKLPQDRIEHCRKTLIEVNGHLTLFRSEDKSAGVFSPLAPPLDRIHRELKKQFDPAGVFNRDRMYADF
jgi:glycolate oxidase FAD binding subunit